MKYINLFESFNRILSEDDLEEVKSIFQDLTDEYDLENIIYDMDNYDYEENNDPGIFYKIYLEAEQPGVLNKINIEIYIRSYWSTTSGDISHHWERFFFII